MLQSKLTRQVAQAPGDLGCVCIAPYDITHGFMVSCDYNYCIGISVYLATISHTVTVT